MSYAIRIMGLAAGGSSSIDGQWLVEYDPSRPGVSPAGRPTGAHIVTTTDPAKAARFTSARQAHATWTAESGLPYPRDRPLTAFTIAIDTLED